MKNIALIILLSLSGLSAYGQSAIELNEVTVKAKSVIRTPDGMILIPDREQTRHSASGYDLVRNLMIPGVSVNVAEGKVDALGGAVSLYIDGQPAEAREVRQLRPADVARIQYMETPTGRYAGDRTAINFILKKRDSGGYVGIDALQRIGYMGGDYNLSAKLYSGKTQYTLFSGTDYKSIHGVALTGDEIIMFPQSIIGREFATNDSKTVSNSQYAWFRVRNKNERRTLRATFNFVRSASPEDYSSSSLSYT
ncbi:MAG: TonB-dependent receptor, partial [Muribaculaceae bacterium]|nr:TonB-dependent receptor [Muribaculaceae bacterium]